MTVDDRADEGGRGETGEIDGFVALAVFALGLTAGMLILLIAFQLVPDRPDESAAEFGVVRDFAARYYVEELDDEELTTRALSGMLQSLDAHSNYFDRSRSEGHRRRVEGDFRGTGIVFRATTDEPRILFPVKDSPAWDAGVRVGDRILAIDDVALAGLTADEIRAELAPRGRAVLRMRVEGLDGEERLLDVQPRVLVEPSVRHAHVFADAPAVGYLAITSFTNNTPDEFDATVAELVQRGARAIVLDLRGNLGGVLDAAVHIVGRFVDEGVVVSSEGRIARQVQRADAVEPLFEALDVVVLVDRSSASASEVVASALQDHRQGVVVGEPTYGKGLIQSTRSFPRFGSRAKVTSGYFYTPSGRNFDRTVDPSRDYGILPDLVVDVPRETTFALHVWLGRFDPPAELLDQLEAWDAESEDEILPAPPDDPQLDAALALLSGAPPIPARITSKRP